MKYLLLVIYLLITSCSLPAQKKKEDPFQIVMIPDSLKYELIKKTYLNNSDLSLKTGLYVFNMINKKDYIFKDGIYYFKGFGPHFPKRIFIFNKGVSFIFKNEGAFNPKGVLQEYIDCINRLELTDIQAIEYSKIINDYLEQELGNTYGTEVRKE